MGSTENAPMSKIAKSDLRYEYSWKATAGDNPHLIHNDARHLSRKEGYEMLDFLNHLGWASDNKTVVYNAGPSRSRRSACSAKPAGTTPSATGTPRIAPSTPS
ncbi:hypothetical protein NBA59_23325, partial [Salmonella sp. NW1263]